MDISLLVKALQTLIQLVATTFPKSEVSYDFAGFNLKKAKEGPSTWEFVIGNSTIASTQAIFEDEYAPLWFVILSNPDTSEIDRIVYQRNNTQKSYIAVSWDNTTEVRIDALDPRVEGPSMCFADLNSTLYCFSSENGLVRLGTSLTLTETNSLGSYQFL